jgi:predicted HicB family RNase H-like nuclease
VKTTPMLKLDRINMKVSPRFKDEVREAAARKELSVSAWITLACKNELAREKETR